MIWFGKITEYSPTIISFGLAKTLSLSKNSALLAGCVGNLKCNLLLQHRFLFEKRFLVSAALRILFEKLSLVSAGLKILFEKLSLVSAALPEAYL